MWYTSDIQVIYTLLQGRHHTIQVINNLRFGVYGVH